jgi:ubiquinone/menaquinone biosynthesis C-methylase UbiE
MQNDVYTKEYWERQAQVDGFFSILSQEQYRDPKVFWNTTVGLEVEMMSILKPTDAFLDLGCGYGRIARHVHQLVGSYTGVDFSTEMITKAKEFHKDCEKISFFNNNGKDLSIFPDNTFDIVYSCLLFQHLPKETIFNYIAEAGRVLKSNGIAFIYNIPKASLAVNGLTKQEFEGFGNECRVREDAYYFHFIGEKH